MKQFTARGIPVSQVYIASWSISLGPIAKKETDADVSTYSRAKHFDIEICGVELI